MEGAPRAAEGLAALVAARDRASARVIEVERAMREAGQAREEARRALVEAEREGVGSAQRAKLERALSEAEERVNQRWPERIAGARAAVSDRQSEVRAFVTGNFDALLSEREAEGEAVAARLTAAAEVSPSLHVV